MRQYLRYLGNAVLLAGGAGFLLNLWLLLSGTDEKGLYSPGHPAWFFLCVLSILVLAFVWFLTRRVGVNRNYRGNFSPSLPGAVGSAAAAVGLVVSGIGFLTGGTGLLYAFIGLLGILSGAGLGLAAVCRYSGRNIHFSLHMLPCLYFTLRAFILGRQFGSEPEAARYLFPMLASLALIPASYQLWAFDVNLGDRRKSLFWSLLAAYLCIVSIPMGGELLYAAAAAWLLTNLCVLRYLRRRPAAPPARPMTPAAPPSPFVPEPVPDAPEAPAEADASPAEASPEPSPAPEDTGEYDADAILSELMREIDSQIF